MANRRLLGLHLLSLAIAVGIAVALLEPVPAPLEAATQGRIFPFDKLVHFLLFLAAAPVWRRSFAALALRSPGVATVAAAALYGGLLELGQGLWTPRDAEVADMVAGALGAFVALLLRDAIARRRPARPAT